ncbi:Neocarzinostatin family protein [Frankia sp. AiPs1]|uniref:hypothetical protein n=1 Tax=Frankia sp. AiPa1 TaxID=573492 RepID=UPI00202ACFDF|nr:hypothetical protein [Frankia sp. AiPa1]MCL9760559.1 hypothetical protein [Frankia sp. AiPa1]
MNISGFGRTARGTAVAFAAAFAVMGATPAFAAGSATQFNDAKINIQGGSGASLTGCLNYARGSARNHVRPRSNYCRNVADASGGTVHLKNVSLFVDQENDGGPGRSYNNASVNISGGDSTAIAACVNYVQGTASEAQANTCRNSATSNGGNVTLDNVDLTLVQTNT